MLTQKDSKNHPYKEITFKTKDNGGVRVTSIAQGWSGSRIQAMRIQIRDGQGHLRPGPEIPLDVLPVMIAAINALLLGE